MKVLLNKTQLEKNIIINIINNKLINKSNNCIYGLNNKLFNNIIKIGSTVRPEFRKYDYHTSSPYPFFYDWIFYLKDFNCYLFDDILKHELDESRIKENGSIEFYNNIIDYTKIEYILQKYDITYKLELGDKFKKKPENYKKHYDKIDLKIYNEFILKMDIKELQLLSLIKSISKDRLQNLGINIDTNPYNLEDDCDHSYLDGIISKLNFNLIKDHIKCQSIDFIYDKMKNPNKINRKSLILGDIQSGKTNEIIQLSYFICRYLKIPVIIMLQNKKAGITQLCVRLDQYNQTLKKNNINFQLKYKITSGQDVKKKYIASLFHPQTHHGEIIICLCNPKQLNKIKDSIKLCQLTNNNKIAPFICLIDEYDDLIKSRHDIEESNKNKKKKTEIPALFLQQKSYLSIGITATLLAPMMQEDKLTKHDIFKLTTNDNYVGYRSDDRLHIEDISEDIIRPKGKKTTKLNSNSISSIIKKIEKSINDIKPYSITLFNISDKKDDHRQYSEDIRNEFPSWSVVQFHSNEDNKIICELPENNSIVKEEEIRIGDKVISIKLHKCRIPDHKLKYIENDIDRFYDKYSIEFENMSIQEVITKLLEYTNKICIMSGRMATRGISFVNNDYSKHITDLIYVPSDASHVTRNVQDMRIYGNFKKDGIKLTLYVEKTMYEDNIKTYHTLQTSILDQINQSTSIKEGFMSLTLDSEKIPTKKIDRPALMKGLSFIPDNTWGVPLNTHNIDEAKEKVKTKYGNYNINVYSEKFEIDIDKPFESPKKTYKEIKKVLTPEQLNERFGKKIGKIPLKINHNILDINNKTETLLFIKKYWKEITNIKYYEVRKGVMERKNGINKAINENEPYNYGNYMKSGMAWILQYLNETYYDIVSIEKNVILPEDDYFVQDKSLIKYYKECIDRFTKSENTVQYIYSDYKNGWPLHNPFHIEETINRKVPNICYYGEIGIKKMTIIVRNIQYNQTQKKSLSLDFNEAENNNILIFYSKEGYHYAIKNSNLSSLKDKHKK